MYTYIYMYIGMPKTIANHHNTIGWVIVYSYLEQVKDVVRRGVRGTGHNW